MNILNNCNNEIEPVFFMTCIFLNIAVYFRTYPYSWQWVLSIHGTSWSSAIDDKCYQIKGSYGHTYSAFLCFYFYPSKSFTNEDRSVCAMFEHSKIMTYCQLLCGTALNSALCNTPLSEANTSAPMSTGGRGCCAGAVALLSPGLSSLHSSPLLSPLLSFLLHSHTYWW